MLGEKFDEALNLASDLHRAQKKKIDPDTLGGPSHVGRDLPP